MAASPVLLLAQQLDHGGSERQLAELAKSLDRSRFLPHVAAFRPDGLRWRELRDAGLPVSCFPVASLHDPRGALHLARYLRLHDIQLVHTFDAPANLYAVPAARLAGCKVVLSSQRAHRSLLRPALRPWLRLVDALSDGIVVNCDFLRRHLLHDERVPARRIHLCYNGVDLDRFHPSPRARPPALRDASLVIGAVSVLRPEKGLDTLLDAFARVASTRPGLRLVLVGSGENLPALRARAATLGLADIVLFEPRTGDVPGWLRAIDIFVLPSLSEALSNSLMEAMACGCCPVASRAGGNPELVRHGETGLLFDPGDAAALATALTLLVDSPALRADLAATAALLIRGAFGIQRAARRMGEIYSSFLERAV